ncbi:MAG: hypothetical protein LBD62_01265, partial [Candidatus Margulisbacteria bacterium]|nr:hypothetical protein [Candidatus Margulisiibacteriota bacterium]
MAVKRINPNPPKKSAKTPGKKPVPVNMQAHLYKTEEDPEDNVDFSNKNAVVTAFTPLVQIIAANITAAGKLPPNIHFDDLMSYGTSGLIKAWENFDRTKNVKFKVYAS